MKGGITYDVAFLLPANDRAELLKLMPELIETTQKLEGRG